MHVRFEMTGGYGGLFALEPLVAEVDSASLPEDERDRVLEMARAAIASTVVPPEEAEPLPDLMTYKLRIVDDGVWEAVLDDRTVPERAWPLIDYMRDLALRGRADRG